MLIEQGATMRKTDTLELEDTNVTASDIANRFRLVEPTLLALSAELQSTIDAVPYYSPIAIRNGYDIHHSAQELYPVSPNWNGILPELGVLLLDTFFTP